MLSIAIKDTNVDVENWVALILVLGFLIKHSFYPLQCTRNGEEYNKHENRST